MTIDAVWINTYDTTTSSWLTGQQGETFTDDITKINYLFRVEIPEGRFLLGAKINWWKNYDTSLGESSQSSDAEKIGGSPVWENYISEWGSGPNGKPLLTDLEEWVGPGTHTKWVTLESTEFGSLSPGETISATVTVYTIKEENLGSYNYAGVEIATLYNTNGTGGADGLGNEWLAQWVNYGGNSVYSDWGMTKWYDASVEPIAYAEYVIVSDLARTLADLESNYTGYKSVQFSETWGVWEMDEYNSSSEIVDIVQYADALTESSKYYNYGWLYYYDIPHHVDEGSITVELYLIDGNESHPLLVSNILSGEAECSGEEDVLGNKCSGPYELQMYEGDADGTDNFPGSSTTGDGIGFWGVAAGTLTVSGYEGPDADRRTGNQVYAAQGYDANNNPITRLWFSEGYTSRISQNEGQTGMYQNWMYKWSGNYTSNSSTTNESDADGEWNLSSLVIRYTTKDL